MREPSVSIAEFIDQVAGTDVYLPVQLKIGALPLIDLGSIPMDAAPAFRTNLAGLLSAVADLLREE